MTPAIVAHPHHNNQRWAGWEGEIVGISGQFLAVRPTHDPVGNECGKRMPFFADPLELKSPIAWEEYRP